MKLHILTVALSIFAAISIASRALAVPVIGPNAAPLGGVTTDLFDVSEGSAVATNTAVIGAATKIQDIFGGSNGAAESGNALFADGNGGVGFTDFVIFRTPSPVQLSNINLRLGQDGATANRSASSYTLSASSDGITFAPISTAAGLSNYNTNYGSGQILATENVNVTGQFFRLDVTKATTGGPRVLELDGFGAPVVLDVSPTIFNAVTNNTGEGDEAPGLATNFSISSAVLGTDTVEDAFGNNNGAVEPTTFLFGGGGVPDNGNGIIGDSGETVDFIEWQTTSPVSLAGYELTLGGDGFGNPNRDTELVRFLVEGVQVDLFDNNGADGALARHFAAPIVGDDFRIEFTRTSAQGPRIFEINAILSVPEPSTLILLGLGIVGLLGWRGPRSR